MLSELEGMCRSAALGRQQRLKAVSACSLTFKELDHVPYGDTLDGSARRAKYVKDLEAYMGSALQPILNTWEGELPAHLQKVCNFCP